jgi:hypothetical protein
MPDVLTTFSIVLGLIWLFFNELDNLLTNTFRERLYMVLTRPRSISSDRQKLVIRFCEYTFGFRKVGKLYLPSVLRTLVFTTLCALFTSYLIGFRMPTLFLFCVTAINWIVANVWLDVASVTLTRYFLTWMAGRQLLTRIAHLALMTVATLLIGLGAGIMSILIFEGVTSKIVDYSPYMQQEAAMNESISKSASEKAWDESPELQKIVPEDVYETALYDGMKELTNDLSMFFLGFSSIFTSVISGTIMLILFILNNIIISWVRISLNIGFVRTKIENYIKIEDHPAKVIGYISITLFSIMFWFIYVLSLLV